MNKDQIYQLIHQPERLMDIEVADLDGIIKKYPYFQSAYLFKAKILFHKDPEEFEKFLPLVAAVVASRKKLYQFIHEGLEVIEFLDGLEQEEEIEFSDSLEREEEIEIFVDLEPGNKKINPFVDSTEIFIQEHLDQSSVSKSLTPIDNILKPIPVGGTLNFLSWLRQGKAMPHDLNDNHNPKFKLDQERKIKEIGPSDDLGSLYTENIFHQGEYDQFVEGKSKHTVVFNLVGESQKKQMDIIDRFIEREPSIRIRRDFEDPAFAENKAKGSAMEEEDLVSETLAEIFIQQKLYKKAVNAYKKLSLKNPEKSLYFAGQIEKILKLYPELNQE